MCELAVASVPDTVQGLVQGAHDWFIFIQAEQALQANKFKRSTLEEFTQVLLWADDYRISSDSEDFIYNTMQAIGDRFKIKVTDASHWLGMRVEHYKESGVMQISRKNYIQDMLDNFGMTDCKPERTPAAPNTKLE